MSWEKPIVPRMASEYYSPQQGYTKEPLPAVAAYLLDQLAEKLHHQHTVSGQEEIYYSWWNNIDPKRKLAMPSIAIAIDFQDDPKSLSYGIPHRGSGQLLPGRLILGQINIVTLARSVAMRDTLEDHVVAVLEKIIATDASSPLLWIDKDIVSGDIGFSTTNVYMASSLYQMMAEVGFIKITRLNFGLMRHYLGIYEYDDGSNGDDSYYSDLINSYNMNEEDIVASWRSLKLTFTPNHT